MLLAQADRELAEAWRSSDQVDRAGQEIVDRWHRAEADRARWQKLLGLKSAEQRALRLEAGQARRLDE